MLDYVEFVRVRVGVEEECRERESIRLARGGDLNACAEN